MDWTPIVTAIEPAAVTLAGAALTGLAAFGARYINAKWHLAILADAVQTAGGVAYDALAAATRTSGAAPDYAAARAVALSEGAAALLAAVPTMTAANASVKTAGALGVQLASDPAFSAAGGAVATAVAEAGQGAAAVVAKA